jgi:hypothetical protein
VAIDNGHGDISARLDQITEDKPFADHAEAIAALDWIAATSNTLRNELDHNADEVGSIADIQQLLTRLAKVESSIKSEMKRAEADVPQRHQESAAGPIDLRS